MKPPRARHPRINCSIPGCKRGSTAFEPGTHMICGKCWRKAPREQRREYGLWRGRLTRAEKRDDPRAGAYAWKVNAAWNVVLRTLTESPIEGEISPLMAEELRKAGLL